MGSDAVLKCFLRVLPCWLWLLSKSSEATIYMHPGPINDEIVRNLKHWPLLREVMPLEPPVDRRDEPSVHMREVVFEEQFLAQMDKTMQDPLCAQLYTKVGQYCLSIFFIGKMSWMDARSFCQATGGDLFSLSDPAAFSILLDHLNQQRLTVDLWTGGQYINESVGWTWIDNSAMKFGSPYWAVRHVEQCVTRSITTPGPDPNTTITRLVNDGQCYHYVQAPNTPPVGHCAALTYQHYHYITDEDCFSKRSPLCIHPGQSNQKGT